MDFSRIWKGALAVIASGLLHGNVQAAVVDCSAAHSLVVSNTSDCQYSTDKSQDFLGGNPQFFTVNSEAFFGYSDWSFIAKDDDNGLTSGLWSFDPSTWNAHDQIMLIFKGPNGKSFLFGYLVETGEYSGTWADPFTPFTSINPRGKEIVHDVSHITYYGRGLPSVDVSESSPLILILMGLLGLCFARRRTQANV